MTKTTSDATSEMAGMSLPARITVSTFAAARIKEIQAMKRCIHESAGNKMAFQKLPKHMRRRAMSHVVKRLPRRLREIHISQMKKSGLPPKSKRPTRRYRRRPLNLQNDYIRRQRKIKWLDTHIWHAKRFHMIDKWGYRLPKQPCDKSFRALYRATARHCLVQDISYKRCIEIAGSYEAIMDELIKITDQNTGLTFGAKCFSEGKKYGELVVFEPSSKENMIRKAIGNVHFFWNFKENDEQHRIMWLFIHPAYYSQLLNVLTQLFNLKKCQKTSHEGPTTYIGSQQLILKELEYELGTFRLTGPLSTAVLKNALRLVDLEMNDKLPKCFKNYSLETLVEQNMLFKNLKDPSYIPSNMVLSLLTYDPRLNLPNKRTKALLDPLPENENFEKYFKNMSLSPLFDESVRKFIRDNKMCNADICNLRSSLLIPGSELSVECESAIPIILLWRTGNKTPANNGYSSGWDVIVPSSWAQSFFLSFVMWGARTGGLRETESIAFERSQVDTLYPDTFAGENEEKYIEEACRERFFRLPPNKRTNFNKFGVVSPFSFNWKILIADWSGEKYDGFSVLRDKRILKKIQEILDTKTNISDIPDLPENCLIPVQLTPLTKGVCSRFSSISIPLQEDYKKDPVEPRKSDILGQKRKRLRQEHKTLLKKLRRRRRRSMKMGKPITPTDVDVLRNYQKEMRSLWLPEPSTIKSSCSRPIIGFITKGDFSFTLGQSKGIGYIVAGSLKTLIRSPQKNKVLLRSTKSRQYNMAVIDVATELF